MSHIWSSFRGGRLALALSIVGVVLAAAGPAGAFAAGPVTWGAPQLADSGNSFGGVACPSATFCVASDSQGQILTSSTPADGSSWQVTNQVSGNPLYGLSCAPDASVCAATDGSYVYTSGDPGDATPTWNGEPLGSVAATSCPTANFCAAVGGETLYTTTDPTAANPDWTPTAFSGVHGTFQSISCPTAQLCVWVSLGGDVFTSSNGGATYTQVTPSPALQFYSVSCESVSLCVAVAGGGQELVSTDPTGSASQWVVRTVETPGSQPQNKEATGILSAVSCPSHLCVALDGNGYAYADANVLSPTSSWTTTFADQTGQSGPGDTVSCPPATYVCYAVDSAGQVLKGTVAKETLTVSRAGSGSGSVAGEQIHCPTTCSAGYPAGTQVTLKATPSAGSLFNGWSGACTGTVACTVTMASGEQVLATFDKKLTAPHGTKITSASIKNSKRSATFKFTAAGTVTGFKCALVKGGSATGAKFAKCSSPKAYTHLAKAKYTFAVEAYNAAGSDPHPATRTFTIG